MRRLPSWVSPIRDVFGFSRRYVVVGGVITLVGLAASVISDRAGGYYLSSLLDHDDPRLCNISIVARLVFALLVAMELLTISGLLVLAIYRHNRDRGRLLQNAPAQTTSLPSLGARTAIALGLMLLFLHLGLYAIAFHADDVCASRSIGEWLHHYAAFVAFAMFYSLGSLILIGFVMLALKRSLLTE